MKERFKKWKYPKIEEGKPTKYNWLVHHKENLKLGYKTDIGAFTYINAKNGVIIEDYVQIGSHSIIMPGITIGENSVIGAFGFVNKNIPPNVIAIGIPVKIIKKTNSR